MEQSPQSREGEMVLHYRVGAQIGRGGMGVVYEAADQKLGRRVALKFLDESSKREEQTSGDLLFEARAASSLNHPNICTIYAVEEFRGGLVLVMELLEGQTLQERIQTGSLALSELIRLATQACNALAAAHEKGIVHGDIKPANLFLTSDGRLKLLDFGVAIRMRGAPEQTGGGIAGTMLYMSPEQFRGERIDGRSDLFSLGVVLYELATGRRLFERANPLLVMDAVLHFEGAAPSRVNPAIPAKLDRMIGRMIGEGARAKASDRGGRRERSPAVRRGARPDGDAGELNRCEFAAGLAHAVCSGPFFAGKHRPPNFNGQGYDRARRLREQDRRPGVSETRYGRFSLWICSGRHS